MAFKFKSLFHFWLLACLFQFACEAGMASQQNQQRALERYAAYDARFIDRRCQRNLGARVDQAGGQKYSSVCRETYSEMQKVAQAYLDREKAEVNNIRNLTSQNANECARSNSEGQRACLELVANGYEKAATIKSELAIALDEAYKKAKELRQQNAKALSAYRKDREAINTAINDARAEARNLRSLGEPGLALDVEKKVAKAPVASANGQTVDAADGNASSISEYKAKIEGLAQEQDLAQKEAESFASAAKGQATQLQQESRRYTEMARQIRGSLPRSVSSTGKSGDPMAAENVPIPKSGDEARAAYRAQQEAGGGQDIRTGGSSMPAELDSRDDVNSDSPMVANSPAAPTGNFAAPATSGASSANGAGASSGLGYSDPFAGSPSPVAGNEREMKAGAQNDGATNSPGPLTYMPGTESSTDREAAAGSETEVGEVEQLAATGGSSGDSDGISGASSDPEVRGADGKPIPSGFSAAGNGRIGGGSQNQGIAAKDQFVPNLASGAVSIAGSDVNSAVAALAEEFGALDLDLDLDLGDLTEEEKAALAPLDEERSRTVAAGRKVASSAAGADHSIQDVETIGLFARARSAHERAQKRGNLILGLKKKY